MRLSRLGRVVAFNIATQAITIGVGFLTLRTTYRHLGADALGLLALVTSFNAAIAGFLDLGLGSTIVRDVAANVAADGTRVRRTVAALGTIYWIVYAVTAAALVLTMPVLTAWGGSAELSKSSAVEAARILTAGSLLAIPRGLYGSVLQGLQRQRARNSVNLASVVVQQVGAVVLLLNGHGLVAICGWIAMTTMVSLVGNAVLVALALSPSTLRPTYRLGDLRAVWPFAGWMAVISAGGTVQTQVDKVVVGRVLPLANVGYYAAATSLLGAGQVATSALADVALPALSAPSTDPARTMAQTHRLQVLHAFAMAPLFAAVVLTEPAVFTFLFSADVARALFAPVVLLAIGYYLNSGLTVPYLLSLARGRPDIAAKANLVELCTVFPLIVGLSLRFGLVGASASWILYCAVEYAYMLPRIGRHCLGLTTVQVLRMGLAPQLLALAIYGTATAAVWSLGLTTLSLLVAVDVVATGVFGLLSLAWNGRELRSAWTLVTG